MKDGQSYFKVTEVDHKLHIGYQQVHCHMIFDVKMENFLRKAWFVSGGHLTKPPATITCTSVVSCETLIITLMIMAINYFEVEVEEIQNALIPAPVTERI